MRNKTISLILTVFLLISSNSKAYTEQRGTALQIYLQRKIAIEGNVPNLGQVAIIRGDESLTARAEKVTLGRISVPGQKIIIDRSIVLSRLASSGIPASAVTLTGAKKIVVTQRHQIIEGKEFAEKALAFLKKNLPGDLIGQFDIVGITKDLVVSGESKDIKLSYRLIKTGMKNRGKVQIAAFCDNKEIGMREVAFRFKYNCRKMVAKVDIPQGGIISAENVNVEKGISNYPEPAGWAMPYGFVARRPLAANTVIRANMLAPVKPKIVIERNQNVVIRIAKYGLLLETFGKARQKGRAGDYIEVDVKITTDTRRIMVKVNENGTVEPVF